MDWLVVFVVYIRHWVEFFVFFIRFSFRRPSTKNACSRWFVGITIWVFPKIGGKPPKWMIYNGSKPYFLMDDLGVFPYISETPIWFVFFFKFKMTKVGAEKCRCKIRHLPSETIPTIQGLRGNLLLVSGRVCQNWWKPGVHVLFTLMWKRS